MHNRVSHAAAYSNSHELRKLRVSGTFDYDVGMLAGGSHTPTLKSRESPASAQSSVHSPHGGGRDDASASCNIDDLVQEQLSKVKEVLSYSHEIAHCLRKMRAEEAVVEEELERLKRTQAEFAEEKPFTTLGLASTSNNDAGSGSRLQPSAMRPIDLTKRDSSQSTRSVSFLEEQLDELATPLLEEAHCDDAEGEEDEDEEVGGRLDSARSANSSNSGNDKKASRAARGTLNRMRTAEYDVARVVDMHSRYIDEMDNSHALLSEDSFFARIVRSHYFEELTLLVIAANTIWIAVDTDYNTAEVLCEAPVIFQIVANLFCSYFFFEIVCRALAYKRCADITTDWHFLFDAALVLMMVWETWIHVLVYLYMEKVDKDTDYLAMNSRGIRDSSVLRVFRVFRLSRILRSANLLRSLPELMILAKGIMAAMRSVVSTLGALALIIYIVGIMFTQLLRGYDVAKNRFDTVPMSCNFLLIQSLCGIDAAVIDDLLEAGVVYYLLFLAFAVLASLTVMNMLIGGVVDVVQNTAEDERDKIRTKEIEFRIDEMVAKMDGDNTGCLDKDEFELMVKDPDILNKLKDLGVDLVPFVDFTRWIYPTDGELTVQDFRQIILLFVGNKPATVKDVAEVRKCLSIELSQMGERLLERVADVSPCP